VNFFIFGNIIRIGTTIQTGEEQPSFIALSFRNKSIYFVIYVLYTNIIQQYINIVQFRFENYYIFGHVCKEEVVYQQIKRLNLPFLNHRSLFNWPCRVNRVYYIIILKVLKRNANDRELSQHAKLSYSYRHAILTQF